MAQDAALAFSQNLVKSFIQFKLAERQYDLFERREKRYSASLLANQRFAQEGRRIQERQFATTQRFREGEAKATTAFRTRTAERLESTAESLDQYREAQIGAMRDKKPFTEGRIQQTIGEIESGGATTLLGHVMPFRNREGYINHALRKLGPDWLEIAPEAAEIINSRFPDEPPIEIPRIYQPPTTSTVFPTDKIRVRDKEGNLFMLPRGQLEQSLSEGYEQVGVEESIPSPTSTAFPRAEGRTEEPVAFRTTPQDGSAAFLPRTPDTGAAILGGSRTQGFLPPDPDEGLFDRLDTLETGAQLEISAEKRTQAIDFVKSVMRQEKYADLDNDAKIEIGRKMLAEQGVEVTATELTEAWLVP